MCTITNSIFIDIYLNTIDKEKRSINITYTLKIFHLEAIYSLNRNKLRRIHVSDYIQNNNCWLSCTLCDRENFEEQNQLMIFKVNQTINLKYVENDDETTTFHIAPNGIIFILITQDSYLNCFLILGNSLLYNDKVISIY